MSMVQQTDENFFLMAAQEAVRKRVIEIQNEEIEAANKRVAERVRAEVDRLALQVVAKFDLYRNGTDLVIRVRKDI
jgi:hypothetical protein